MVEYKDMADARAESNLFPAVAGETRASALEIEVVEYFDEMRERLLRYLLGFGLPVHDCEEIVQETFLALFQHLQRGRSRQNLRGWLFRVAHNLGLRRRQRTRPTVEIQDSLVDPGPNPEDQFAANQTQKRLMAVLHALPEQDRRCLSLRAEGLRYREIAEVLDMSLGGVSLALARSLARIARVAEQ
jgi:RNA polymerase sigma-70 factor (ECF subfamily)